MQTKLREVCCYVDGMLTKLKSDVDKTENRDRQVDKSQRYVIKLRVKKIKIGMQTKLREVYR